MVNPKICAKCEYGEDIDGPMYDKQGKKQTQWSVNCKKSKICDEAIYEMLLIYDNPPTNCPYLLEHQISMQGVTKDDIRHIKSFE